MNVEKFALCLRDDDIYNSQRHFKDRHWTIKVT